jgi:hypothetical protein
MAFPQIVGIQLSQRYGAGTADTIDLPTPVSAGDLLIVFHFAENVAGSRTWTAGWTEIRDTAGAGPESLGVAYKIAAGGETTCVCTKTTERFTAIAIRISAASWHGTTPPEITAGATGTSANPDAGSITASWGSADNLFIATFSIDTETSLPVTVWPTNYTGNQTHGSYADISAAYGAICTRELAAATDDPAAFTVTASETWIACTLVVRPAAAAVFIDDWCPETVPPYGKKFEMVAY